MLLYFSVIWLQCQQIFYIVPNTMICSKGNSESQAISKLSDINTDLSTPFNRVCLHVCSRAIRFPIFDRGERVPVKEPDILDIVCMLSRTKNMTEEPFFAGL